MHCKAVYWFWLHDMQVNATHVMQIYDESLLSVVFHMHDMLLQPWYITAVWLQGCHT